MSPNTVTENLLKAGEGDRTEFVASAQAKDAVARAVCGMLNLKGGTVLVGVDENGVVAGGCTEPDAKSLRHFLQASITPQILFTTTLDPVAGGQVIVVDVPEGVDRPYVFDGTIYIRTGSRTLKASAEAMRAMVENRAREIERWERRSASGLSIADLAESLIRETVRNAEQKRGYTFTDGKDVGAVLADLSLSRYGQLTNAADVLFGRRLALRQPQTRLRAVSYDSDKGGQFLDERLFEGPAFELLDSAMAFLKKHVAIGAEFPVERLQRDSRPQYPFDALREGLVNALVHRDYASFGGSISVDVYPGRIEIWNSGRLPDGLTDHDLRRETHASILVNPDISYVFYLHELMERVGRGTFTIVQACRALGLRPPKWNEDSGGVRLTFRVGPGVGKPLSMNLRQEKCLNELRPGKAVRLREYMRQFAPEVSERQARRDLAEMELAGYLEKRGLGPRTEYVRVEKNG